MNKASLTILSVLALTAAPFAAHADAGAGMVTNVTGAAASNVAAYSEIPSGTSIALGTGSITFMHYSSCREVTVTGGSVTVNSADYQATGGKVEESQQACPERVRIASTTAITGGLVMRGMTKVTEIGATPAVAVTGKRAGSVSTIQFIAADKSVVSGTVSNGRVTLASGSSLKAGDRYDMVLIGQGKTQMEMPVQVVASSSPLVVLTVD